MVFKWFLNDFLIASKAPFPQALPSRACCKNCTLPVIFTTSVFPRTKASCEIGINVVKKPDFFYFYNLPRFDVVKIGGTLKKYNISPTGNPWSLFARQGCCKNCTLTVIFTTSNHSNALTVHFMSHGEFNFRISCGIYIFCLVKPRILKVWCRMKFACGIYIYIYIYAFDNEKISIYFQFLQSKPADFQLFAKKWQLSAKPLENVGRGVL